MIRGYIYIYSAVLMLALSALPVRLSAQSPQTEGGTPTVHQGAHIAFEENVWDFGDVDRRGGDVAKEFDFVNDGTEQLIITSVTVSCTCIKAQWSKRPVAVGERGTVRLVYEPHKMEAGTFYKVVEVHSNSPEGTNLLTVHGNTIDRRRRER